MSKLAAYLSMNGIRQAAFAARVGTSQATVSKLVNGDLLPSLVLAVRIERETGGAVPASCWVAEEAVAVEPGPTPEEDAA